MTDWTSIAVREDTKAQLENRRSGDGSWDEFISSEVLNSSSNTHNEPDGESITGDCKRLAGRVDELKATINDLLVAYQLQDDERLKEEMDRAEDLVRGP